MKKRKSSTMGTFDKIWEQIHQEQEWGKYPPEEIIRFTARNFYRSDRPATKLLDMGCGTGAICWYLAREGFDVYGYDGSKTAVAKARQRLLEENLKAEIIVTDAANTSYPDEFFDGIIDSAMICANTADGIRSILKESCRILKKGGRIFSSGLFKIGMSGYGTGEMIEPHTYREMTEGLLAHRGTVHFFDENQIRDFWKLAGFKNIQIDSLERTDGGAAVTVKCFMVAAEK